MTSLSITRLFACLGTLLLCVALTMPIQAQERRGDREWQERHHHAERDRMEKDFPMRRGPLERDFHSMRMIRGVMAMHMEAERLAREEEWIEKRQRDFEQEREKEAMADRKSVV